MNLLEIMVIAFGAMVALGFVGWVIYDTGYDHGWWDKDRSIPPPST